MRSLYIFYVFLDIREKLTKHPTSIYLDKHIELDMRLEAKKHNIPFSEFFELCYQHYKARTSDEDILSLLFKKRKK